MAVSFVVSQLIAVEIPILILVLSELRVPAKTLAARLSGVAAAAIVMAAACLLARLALSSLGMGLSGRAALTIAFGLLVYALALWWLAPDIGRRAVDFGRRLVARSGGAPGRAGPPALTTR